MNLTRTVTSAIPLLKLQNDDGAKPLLPLSSEDPLAYENSPLATIRPLGANPSEVASQLLGPGPWPLRAKIRLPADCKLLHATSRGRDCTIQVTHALRFTMQLTRGDDKRDPKTGKHKLFEISVRTPVHILSVRFLPLLIRPSSVRRLTWEPSPAVLCTRGVYRFASLLRDA